MEKREFSKEFLLSELFAMENEDPVKKVTAAADIVPAIRYLAENTQEVFAVADLDGAHKVIEIREVTKGLINRTLVHPREIYRGAIVSNAASIILVHNHPSGNMEPSQEDIEITRRIKQAGGIIGIEVLDHIIITKGGFYSFLEEDRL